jgi:hypothetical protein
MTQSAHRIEPENIRWVMLEAYQNPHPALSHNKMYMFSDYVLG